MTTYDDADYEDDVGNEDEHDGCDVDDDDGGHDVDDDGDGDGDHWGGAAAFAVAAVMMTHND